MSMQYLMILQESLKKKIDVLDEIIRISQNQSEILARSPIDYEEFDRCVDDKDICIVQLNTLDEGFESLYAKVSAEIQDNRQKYASWIKECQGLITTITDKSVEIQALEARNKQAVEESVRKSRKNFGNGKRSVEVVSSYRRNMNFTNVAQSHFMDQKK